MQHKNNDSMVYIYRFLWMMGYILLFILEMFAFGFLMLTYPIVGAFYFVKTGDVENIPYHFFTPVLWIDEKYKNLLEKIER